MPLLCDLGWHSPRPLARWNEGFYFTTCGRCGCDLVRTAYGRWGVPRGYRVVWQAAAPRNAVSAALVRDDDRASAPEAGAELPIQEVLRHLKNGDQENGHGASERVAEDPGVDQNERVDGEPDAESGSESEAAADASGTTRLKTFPASRIPDFMDRPTGTSDWEAQARTYLVRAAPAIAGTSGGPAREASRTLNGPVGPGWLRSLAPRLFGPNAGEGADGPADIAATEAAESLRARRVLLAAAPIVVALFALIIWGVLSDSPSPPAGPAEFPGAGAVPGGSAPAFVTASILNCRAAPARESAAVMVLARGNPVQVLAYEGEWASLVLDGRQCWAIARYLSVAQPE